MTKTVVIKQEVADALEYMWELGWSDGNIARLIIQYNRPPIRELGLPAGALPHIRALEEQVSEETLIKAIYLGYEREKSLDDAFEALAGDYELYEGGKFADGVEAALDIIGSRDPKYAHLKKWADHGFKNILTKEAANDGPL